ncbi:exodeoxyribonuclease V subunit gamma [Geothrix alkalitolerans]|uniref:exodeoxyribonuclease V subunit gamma n=1 Tax=Geothrix alkalitolerans TaxID=2922724 RepID=UPI001FAED04E|nr:exodeoxyribonuclease V subunit gamma [Geothrix alkalitolerans]
MSLSQAGAGPAAPRARSLISSRFRYAGPFLTMLSLTYANRTERLLETLTEALRQERQAFGIWEPIQLVVPNPNVKRYLLDGLGKSLGILAHFKVDYLDGLWRGPLGQMDPPVRLWNRHALQGAILSVLSQPGALEAVDLQPLKRYLEGDGADLKLMQLAEKAAGLLEDYSLTRPEWAIAWAAGRSVSGAPAELEAWQRGLWNRILTRAEAGPERWTTLAGLLREGRFDRIPLPPRIHVFGLSYAAEVYHRAFEAAARRVDVHLYALNPCQEFWDDLPTEAEQRRRSQRRAALPESEGEADPYALESEADPLLLRRWGRPGRENVRLLNEISDCDFQSAFPEPDRSTLLRRVQDALQHRAACEPGEPDGSVRILACPSPAREAEVVASEIWRLMEAAPADRPLRFSDIAVVVPPDGSLRTAYIDHLRTAFDTTGRIPLVVVDAPSPGLASLLDGAELLLDLPLGRGSRRDLLRALTHPAVTAHFPDLDTEVWARWTEAAGIVRGLGPEDLADEALVEPGFFHWEQGLERLALSAYLPPELTWSDAGFERPSAHAGDAAATAAFVDQASALIQRVRGLRTFHGTPAAWGERLSDHLLAHLGGEDAADTGGRAKLAQALLRLSTLVPPGLEPPILNYRQARELASQALAGIRGEAGGRPHQGVVVGSYAPMRALPFRAVILMGLGEGQFPSPEERQPLDLRHARRKAGDVGAAERDRYLFLEMVLGARESLRLTYPTEDPVSKEARLPSSLVQDLVQSLAPLTLPDLQEQHPRDRFDEAYFPAAGSTGLRSLAPAAHREAQAQTAGRLVAASIPGTEDRPWSSLPLPEPIRKDLDLLVDPCPTPSGRNLPKTLTLRLAHLRAWLECPVQGTAKVRLQLRDEEEDVAELEEEALGTSALHRALLRKEALLRVARQGQDPDAAYHEVRRALQRAGQAAPGIFGQAEIQEDLELLGHQVKALRGEKIRLVRFGPSMSVEEEADEVRPALELAVPVHGETLKVQLVGSLQPQAGDASLFLLKQAGAKRNHNLTDAFKGKLLRAYLDQHLLAAASESELTHRALSIAGRSADGKASGAFRSEVPFSPLDPAAARTRLTSWITELLETREPGLLPIEALLEDPQRNAAELQQWVLDQVANDRSFAAFKTGPLRRAERFDLDPDPAVTAERRLGDFLRQAATGTTEEVE